MEQKPVPGQEALVPPDPETAHRFLVAAEAVVERRARAVDRRALAWLQIGNAIVTAGFVVGYGTLLRRGDTVSAQSLLFALILWGQLAGGIGQRNGMAVRMTRAAWPVMLGGGLMLASAFVVFGFAVWDQGAPDALVLVPGVILIVGLGGYGLVQLRRAAADPPRDPAPPVRLTGGLRAGTILVGVALGLLTLLGAAPDDVTRAVLAVVLLLALVAWLMAFHSDVGLPAIGAAWRWPHILAFVVGTGVPVILVLMGVANALASVVAGAAVILLFVLVSFVPGRPQP